MPTNDQSPVQTWHEIEPVALREDQLKVQCWTSNNAHVVRAATAARQRGQTLSGWLEEVLVIGVSAVEAAGAGADLARVERAVEALSLRVGSEVETAIAHLEQCVAASVIAADDRLTAVTTTAVDRLAEGVKNVVVGRDALLPQAVQRSVGDAAATALAEIHRVLQASTSELRAVVSEDRDAVRSALVAVLHQNHSELSAALQAMQAGLAQQAAVEAVRRKTSRKGLQYERAVAAAVSQIATDAGDGSGGFVGGTPGLSGTGRAGDAVVTFRTLPAPHPKLVVEAKNRDTQLSVDQWVAELDAARANRGATVALGVTKPELMPTDAQVVVLDARTAVVGWDPAGESDDLLRACVLLLRLAALSHNAGSLSLSPQMLRSRLTDLYGALGPFDEMTRHIEATKGALGRIEKAAEAFRRDLERRIGELQAEMQQEEVA